MQAIQSYFPVQNWKDSKPYPSHLPLDIIKIMLSYLDNQALLNLSRTARAWKCGLDAYFESSSLFSSICKAKTAFKNFVNNKYVSSAVLPLNHSDMFALVVHKKPTPWEANHFLVVHDKAFAEIYLKKNLLVINRKNESPDNPLPRTTTIDQKFLGLERDENEIIARELTLDDKKFRIDFKTQELTITSDTETKIIPSVNDIDLMGRDLLIATDRGLIIYDPFTQTSRILYSQKFTRVAADVKKGVIRGYNQEECFCYELHFNDKTAQTTVYDKYESLKYLTKGYKTLQKVAGFFKRFGIGYFESAKGLLLSGKKYFIIGAAVITPILPIMGLIVGATLPMAAVLLAIGFVFSLIAIAAILNGVGLFIGTLHAVNAISESDVKHNFGS